MNSVTSIFSFFSNIQSLAVAIFLGSAFVFPKQNALPVLVLQCPDDIVVAPVHGECNYLLNFNGLDWSADATLQSAVFSPGPGYPFPYGTTDVTLTATDLAGTTETCTFQVTYNPPPSGFMVCSDAVAIEFEGTCTQEVFPFDILVGEPYQCEESYSVEILSPLGAPLGNVVDPSFVGNTWTVRVTDPIGLSCWGSIVVETDGMPQIMTCPADVTIFCHEPYDTLGIPSIEGCFLPEQYTHTYSDQRQNSFCNGDDIAFTVSRAWSSADPNQIKTNCTQVITAKRPKFSDIVFPPNLDGVQLPKLSCLEVNDVSMDAHPGNTGIPLINGYDPAVLACNLTFVVEDEIENLCGNHLVIKRKWEAFDYCRDEFFVHIQTIEIADETGPAFTVPDTILFSSNDDCSGTVLLPKIDFLGDCSDYEILLQTPWETFNVDSVYTSFPQTPGFYPAVYTATDACGNASKDTIIVQVSNGLIANCLEPVSVSADYYLDELKDRLDAEDFSVLDVFGTPSFFANCDFDTTVSVQVNLDPCFVGNITRTHTVNLENNPITCQQTIAVHTVSDLVVKFPQNHNGEVGHLPIYQCSNEAADFGEPIIFNETCELVAVSFQDQIFTDEPGACYKIIRTWTVINWCVVGAAADNEVVEESELAMRLSGCLDYLYQGGLGNPCDLDGDYNCDDRTFRDSWRSCNLPGLEEAKNPLVPDTDPDPNPWDGYITYQQVIKANDDHDPVFTNSCQISDVCLPNNACTTTLQIPTPLVDDCSPNPVITYQILIGSIWVNGPGPHSGIGRGTYQVRYLANDNCNNAKACETTLKVVDCTPPTVVCKDIYTVSLLPLAVPLVEVLAASLVATGGDNCPGFVEYSYTTDQDDFKRVFTCDDLGPHPLTVHATDVAGNQSTCLATIVVDMGNNPDLCNVGDGLFGNVDDQYGIGVKDVVMRNTWGFPAQTNPFGNYTLPNPQSIFPFFISPYKNDDPLNGVTTFDVVQLTRHILGTVPFDHPFKFIAADANRSNTVTTFDVVEIRKVILGVNSAFPANTSWRFLPAGFVFNNPANPLSQPLPDTVWINSPGTITSNFTGIKIGDVNGSADPALQGAVEERHLSGDAILESKKKWVSKGQVFQVPVYLKTDNIIAFQGSFGFDLEKLEYLGLEYGIMTSQDFGPVHLPQGLLHFSYHDTSLEPIPTGQSWPLFKFKFKARSSGQISDWLGISPLGILAEGYTFDIEITGLQWQFVPSTSFGVSPAKPNPFWSYTYIPFQLTKAGDVTCTFLSADGRVQGKAVRPFPEGDSQWEVSASDLPVKGLVLYRLESEEWTETGKLVLLE